MQQPTRWMGVDLGNARIGLALSDPDLGLATPLGNIQVYADYFEALDQVVDLVWGHQVAQVVVGYPLNMDGSEGKAAKKARRWAGQLFKRLNPGAATADPADEVVQAQAPASRSGAEALAAAGRPVGSSAGFKLAAGALTGENPAENGLDELAEAGQIPTIEVTLVDERLTTVSAHHQLAQAGRGSKRHRSVVDQQAAVLILQSALEKRRNGKGGV